MPWKETSVMDEPMHRTLKEAVLPQADLHTQQRHYGPYREDYNWEWSHEALDRPTPGRVYQASPRPYPSKLPRIKYEAGLAVQQVLYNGEIKWQGKHVYVSEILAEEPLGLTPLDEDTWELHYSFHVLGVLKLRMNTITPAQGWHGAT